MNWYILTKTAQKTIKPKGKIHQAKPIFSREIPATKTQWAKYLYHDLLPESLPIPLFQRIRGASITDWMTTVITNDAYPLISSRLSQCLTSFNLGQHNAYDTQVVSGQDKHPFKVLMQTLQLDIIDYKRSTFCTYQKDLISDQYEYQEVENISSYEELVTHNARFGKSVYLKENIPYDGFLFKPNEVVFLVNAKIKAAIEEEKFTGIALLPIHQGENFIEGVYSKLLKTEKGC